MVATETNRPRPATTEAVPVVSDQDAVRPSGQPTELRLFLKNELPMSKYEDDIKKAIREHDRIVLVGMTGSGKTSGLPVYMQEAFDEMGIDWKFIVTQPRRIAVERTADRVSKTIGKDKLVGWRHGKGSNVDEQKTKIIFTVDGSLVNLLGRDPLLKEYNAVMVDEAHERSNDIDIEMARLKIAQEERKKQGLPPLKIFITSATINEQQVKDFWEGAVSFNVEGKSQPIDDRYDKTKNYELEEMPAAMTERAKQVLENTQERGNILMFLPGKAEIEAVMQKLRTEINDPNVEILPLHGEISDAEQAKVFADSGKTKIIVASPMAATSVTFDADHVFVSGFVRQPTFDKETGISGLATVQAEQAIITQMRGRVGRYKPGVAHYFFTPENFKAREMYPLPEMKRSNLAEMILRLKTSGVDDVDNFPYFERPAQEDLAKGKYTLQLLGALDENGKLVADDNHPNDPDKNIGKLMGELQMDPHLARMLIEAHKRGCLPEVATIVAFLTNTKKLFNARNAPNFREANAMYNQLRDPESDFLTFLNIWTMNNAEPNDAARKTWQEVHYLGHDAIYDIYENRRDIIKTIRDVFQVKFDEYVPVDASKREEIQKSVTAGLVDNVLVREGTKTYTLADGRKRGIEIDRLSTQFGKQPAKAVTAELFSMGDLRATYVQPVIQEWVDEVAPYLNKIIKKSMVEVAPASPSKSEPELAAAQAKLEGAIKKADEDTKAVIETPATVSAKPVESISPSPKKERKTVIGELKQIYSEVKAELRKIWEEFKGAFKRK